MSRVYPTSDLKKELQQLSSPEMLSLCLRLAHFKKENKELLTYLLFKANDVDAFIKEYKEEMDGQFKKLSGSSYIIAKGLRKIATQMNNQMRYSGSELVKIEFLLHYCNNYIHFVNYHSSYKPLRSIFFRHAEKAKAALQTLHEDLQHDYGNLYQEMLKEAENEIFWFEKKSGLL